MGNQHGVGAQLTAEDVEGIFCALGAQKDYKLIRLIGSKMEEYQRKRNRIEVGKTFISIIDALRHGGMQNRGLFKLSWSSSHEYDDEGGSYMSSSFYLSYGAEDEDLDEIYIDDILDSDFVMFFSSEGHISFDYEDPFWNEIFNRDLAGGLDDDVCVEVFNALDAMPSVH